MEQGVRSSDNGPVRLQVFLDEQGVLRLWSVRIEFERAKHEISFPECNRASSALVPVLAVHMRRIADLLRSGGRLDRPGPMVELEGGLLSDLTACARFGSSGFVEIDVTYAHFFGTMSCLFSRAKTARDPSLKAREKIAVEALVDIAGPLLGIAQQAGEIGAAEGEAFRAQLAQIGARAQELEDRLQQLRSYLSALQSGPPSGLSQPLAPMRRAAASGAPANAAMSARKSQRAAEAPPSNIFVFPKTDPASK
ncbi:MAG: hypothetical protein ACRBBK_01665 [Paracoccaceae bacterium]